MDEGRLHGYLDGELDADRRADLEAHLADCRACRGQLDEARALREESRFLLRGAGPAAIDEQPFGLIQARADRERGGARASRAAFRTAAWAASLVLALGIGWFGRTLLSSAQRPKVAATQAEPSGASDVGGSGASDLEPSGASDTEIAAAPAPTDAATRAAGAAAASPPAEAAAAAPGTPAGSSAGAPGTPAGSSAGLPAAAEDRLVLEALKVAPASPTRALAPSEDAERERAEPARAARSAAREPAPVLAQAIRPDSSDLVVEAVAVASDAAAGAAAAAPTGTAAAWRAIDADEAAELLGHEPYVVPDLDVLALETTAPAGVEGRADGVVRVRQRLEDGSEIELYQRREESTESSAPRRRGREPGGAVVPPPRQPTPRPPAVPSPTPSGKPEPAKPTSGNGGIGSILDLFGKDKREAAKQTSEVPWLVRFTADGDATMLAGSVRITARAAVPKERLRALLERVR